MTIDACAHTVYLTHKLRRHAHFSRYMTTQSHGSCYRNQLQLRQPIQVGMHHTENPHLEIGHDRGGPVVTRKRGLHPGFPIQTNADGIAGCSIEGVPIFVQIG